MRLPRLSLKAAVPLTCVVLLVAAGCTGDDDQAAPDQGTGQQGGGTLQEVIDRDMLRCGVNDAVPGFGFVDEEGEFQGFDVDFCRAVAAAVLGDAEKVEFKPLTAEQRFTALQAGEIDVLIRNTTWTATRDGQEGATFLTTTFYDGQGMMVRSDSDFEELEDLDGAAICTLSGTTTEQNLATVFAARGIDHEPLPFEDNEALAEAFRQERCDAWTSDKSQLAGVRSNWPENEGGSDALRVLDETFSKEPLGPVVRDGDSQWAQVVDWVALATIQAEEFGITSDNLEQMRDSEDPAIATLLGDEELETGLGLEGDFAVNIISSVGNYGEIYARNVGPDTALGLERGLNALWTDGGLLYAPPYK